MKHLARKEAVSEAELVRRAIEAYGRLQGVDPIMETVRLAEEGPADGAEHHDLGLTGRTLVPGRAAS